MNNTNVVLLNQDLAASEEQTQLPRVINTDEILNLISERFKDIDSLELENLNLIERNLRLIIERNTSEKNLRAATELSVNTVEMLTEEKLRSETLALEILGLTSAVENYANQITQQRDGNLGLLGELTVLKKQLTTLRGLGDIKKTVELNKNLRLKNSTLTSELNKEKTQNRKVRNDLNRLIHQFNESGKTLVCFASQTGETVELHSKVLTIKTPKGIGEFLTFKYWNPKGIGRLVTWNGEQLMFADGGAEVINSIIAPSKEITNFLTGWYTSYVYVNGNKQQLKDPDAVLQDRPVQTTKERVLACLKVEGIKAKDLAVSLSIDLKETSTILKQLKKEGLVDNKASLWTKK